MSEYGLRLSDSSGNIILNSDNTLCIVRYTVDIAEDAEGSIDLTDLSGRQFVAFAISTGSGVTHTITISGITVSWSKTVPYPYVTSSSKLYVLVYG